MFPAKFVKDVVVSSGNETAKPIYRQTIVIKPPSQTTSAPEIPTDGTSLFSFYQKALGSLFVARTMKSSTKTSTQGLFNPKTLLNLQACCALEGPGKSPAVYLHIYTCKRLKSGTSEVFLQCYSALEQHTMQTIIAPAICCVIGHT